MWSTVNVMVYILSYYFHNIVICIFPDGNFQQVQANVGVIMHYKHHALVKCSHFFFGFLKSVGVNVAHVA